MTDPTPRSLPDLLFAAARPLIGFGVCTYILITKTLDGSGYLMFGGLAAYFLGRAIWRVHRELGAATTPAVTEAADGVSHLPADEQVAKIQRLRLIAVVATFAFGIWAYVKLSAFERGAEAPERLWAPIAFLYNTLGLWPAVLVLPAVGVGVWVAGGKMMERAESGRELP